MTAGQACKEARGAGLLGGGDGSSSSSSSSISSSSSSSSITEALYYRTSSDGDGAPPMVVPPLCSPCISLHLYSPFHPHTPHLLHLPSHSPSPHTAPPLTQPLPSRSPSPHTAPATVLLNPPREGVVELQVLEAARHAQSVIYLSCNPVTLARDQAALETTHHVTDAALFDQFPHTPHAEVGVVLQRQRLTRRPRLTNSFRREADTKPKVKV